jgi:hypothetical protein
MLGFLIGTLAKGASLSIGLGLVWLLVVESLLRPVGSLLGPFEAAIEVLPGTAGGSLIGSLIGVVPGGPPGVVDTVSGSQAVVTVAAYLAVVPLLTLALVRRRDVA